MATPMPGTPEWSARVDEILATYEGDPEAAHSDEDDLLWVFVESMPYHIGASDLLRLRAADRTRWYA